MANVKFWLFVNAEALQAVTPGAPSNLFFEEKTMSLGTILLIVIVLMLIGAIPTWPHSRSWGYGPSGGLGLVLLIVLILLLLGMI